MERIAAGEVELECEVVGSGDPVLLIPASLAAGWFQPLTPEPALAGHHRLIRSYGALIALQLAHDRPALVGSVALLEPNLLPVPGAAAFNDEIRPAFAAHRKGDEEGAVGHFLAVVSGLRWEECRTLMEQRVAGAVAQAIGDADTFFTVEVPALRHWRFGAEQAARITSPVVSVLGGSSHTFLREGRELLRRWFPQLEEFDLPGAGHLLQVQDPETVAGGLRSFFARHPLTRPAPN
jgi:3-oxoadipate enol-lactonase